MSDPALSILLVEDEPAHAEAVRRAFQAAGRNADLRVAPTLSEYRQLVAARPPDIAIMDLNLPDGRAVEVLCSPAGAGPFPVVVMTSHSNEQVAVEAVKAGALDYLVKSAETFADLPRIVERGLREWNLLQGQQRAEQALRLSEERFHLSMQATSDGLWDWNLETGQIYYSPGYFSMLGYPVDAFPGIPSSWMDLIHPDDREHALRETTKCVDGGSEQVRVEFRMKALNGDWRWVLNRGQSVARDGQGRALRMVGTHLDITERKRAEEHLRRTQAELEASQARYVDLYDLAPVGYLTLSEQGLILEANLTVAGMLGVARAALVQQRLSSFILREDQGTCDRHRSELSRTGEPQVWELRLVRRSGAAFWARLEAAAARDSEGHPVCRTVISDTTEQKQAEARLRDAQNARSIMLATTFDGFWLVNTEGMLLDVNSTYVRQSGYSREELLGMRVSDLEVQESAGATADRIRRVIETGRYQFEAIHRRQDGSLWNVEVNATTGATGPGRVLLFHRDITERKRAEETLKERVKELHCLSGISALLELPGDSLDEILEGTVLLIPPAWQFPEITATRIVFQGKTFQTGAFQETAWMQASAITVHGAPVGRIEVCYLEERKQRDEGPFLGEERQLLDAVAERLGRTIEQKQAEATVIEQRRTFASILEQAVAGYWDWMIQDATEYMSPAFKRMFGYEDHELPNTPEAWQALIFPEDLPRVLDVFNKHVATHGEFPYYNEVRYRHRDGSTVWVICAGKVTEWDAEGKPVRMVGCHVDITNLKRAEAKILELHRDRSSILESAGEGIVGLDLMGQHTFVNAAAARMLGHEVEELVGRPSHESWHGMHRDETLGPASPCPICATLRDGSIQAGEESFWRRGGARFPARFSSTPIWQGEKIAGAVVTFADITRELEVEKELSRAREFEQLGQLVGGLAHEVRNPLQAIAAGCDALRHEISEDGQRGLIGLIQEQVDRVSRLMSDLLELGKPRQAESFREIPLAAVIEKLEGEWVANSLAEAHPLLFIPPRPTATIRADAFPLLRALLNLLENAAQHAPKGEAITLRVSHHDGKVTLQIEDRGPGILPQHLAQVFDPFFTLRKGGTGLGLPLVRRVVQSHGGSVSLTNKDPGPGLCATVTLPLSLGEHP